MNNFLTELVIFLNENIESNKLSPTEIKEYIVKQCEIFGWTYYFTSKDTHDNTIVYDPKSNKKIVYNEKTYEYEIEDVKHIYYNKYEDCLIESKDILD